MCRFMQELAAKAVPLKHPYSVRAKYQTAHLVVSNYGRLFGRFHFGFQAYYKLSYV